MHIGGVKVGLFNFIRLGKSRNKGINDSQDSHSFSYFEVLTAPDPLMIVLPKEGICCRHCACLGSEWAKRGSFQTKGYNKNNSETKRRDGSEEND